MAIHEDDFVLLLSSLVRSGSGNVLIKDFEMRLTTVCSSQPSEVLLWCIKHLHFEGDYYSEHILMAQTLLRVCRTSELNGNNKSALLNLLLNFSARMVPVSNPVATQVCGAFAASLILEESLSACHGWLGSVCSAMIRAGPGPTGQPSWFCYIASVLGFVAEVCAHPDLQRTYSRRIIAHGQLSKNCRGKHGLVEAVLCQTSSVVDFISQVGDDTAHELRLQCWWCCTKWLELLPPALQERQLAEDQSYVQAALNSLALWAGSGVGARTLDWTACCLRSHPTLLRDRSVLREVYSASLELMEGLCRCVSSDSTVPQAIGTSTVLDSISGQLSATLLPSLRNFLRSVACATVSSSVAGYSGSAAGDATVRAVGMIASCAADLLARAAPDRGDPCEGQQRGSVCAGTDWSVFLAELVHGVEELSSASGQGWPGWLLVEGLQPLLGVLCERVLRGDEGDTCAIAVILERVALLAVKTSRYPCSAATAPDLQDQEDFEDFRSTVRDWLRDIAIPVPRVVSSILAYAVGSLSSYIDSVSSGGPAGGASVPWSEPEAWLHALSAVSKLAVRSLAEESAQPAGNGNSVRSEAWRLLVALSRAECVACRPLCRMGVVLIAEFLPQALCETDQNTNRLGLDCFGALLLSLLHAEAPMAGSTKAADAHFGTVSVGGSQFYQQGAWLPFRVKQDHIGAVSLLKAVTVSGCTVVRGTGSVFLQLPAIYSLLISGMDYWARVSTVAHAVRGEGFGALNAALLSLALSLLVEHSGRWPRSLSSKSACLVHEAAVISLFTSEQQNLAAFVVPVCASIVALLNLEVGDSRVSAVIKDMCDLVFISQPATDARSAVMSISSVLTRSCTVELLLGVVSETFATLRRVCELRLPQEIDEYAGLLKIALLVFANCSFQPELPINLLDALSRLFCECAQLPRLCECVQQHSSLVVAPVFVELSAALPVAQGGHNRQLFRRMILPAASQLVRSIGNLVAASESSQISGLICHLIHNVCSAAVNASSDGVSDGSAASLVVFLSNSIAETALVSCPLGRQKVLLPADTWLVACTTVCTHAHAALDQRDGTFVWKATFKAFASMLGALDVLGKPVPVDLDGHVLATVLSASTLQASRTGYGSPELSTLLMENQIAAAAMGILVRYLVGSAPLRGESDGHFPSSLREHCVATIIKIVLCMGTVRSDGLLLWATWDGRSQRSICASLGDRQQWVRRVLASAECGDWKRFKSNMRLLTR